MHTKIGLSPYIQQVHQVRNLVDDLFDELQEILKEGEKVTIRGFGTFDTKMFKQGRRSPI